jgi:hypothetical protein
MAIAASTRTCMYNAARYKEQMVLPYQSIFLRITKSRYVAISSSCSLFAKVCSYFIPFCSNARQFRALLFTLCFPFFVTLLKTKKSNRDVISAIATHSRLRCKIFDVVYVSNDREKKIEGSAGFGLVSRRNDDNILRGVISPDHSILYCPLFSTS